MLSPEGHGFKSPKLSQIKGNVMELVLGPKNRSFFLAISVLDPSKRMNLDGHDSIRE